jgi:hypothetical protein
MVFAVIGIGCKSDLLMVDGNISADPYIENVDQLGFIDEVDQKHGPFGWIFQQHWVWSRTSQFAMD